MRTRFHELLAGTLAVLLVSLAGGPGEARAEVEQAGPDGFVVEHRFQVAATPEQSWEALVHPERWWPAEHTWSGDPRHLSLDPQAGGCFCERWTDGSAEHARVIQARRGVLLRMQGALGPMQEMALSGVLTITLAPAREGGTTATVTYRVSGDPSHKLEAIVAAVDKVLGQQFGAFAAFAGRR